MSPWKPAPESFIRRRGTVAKTMRSAFTMDWNLFRLWMTQDVSPTGKDRTSIIFSIKDRVGALHAMLMPFSRNKINLTKIESRPSKKKAWDYYFFVDFEGHREDKNVKKALGQLEGILRAEYSDNDETIVIVRADKDARHGKVVDVMDLAKRIGFNKLAIAIQAKSADME